MKVNITFLSFVLLLLAIYLFFYQIVPLYRETLSLAREVSVKKLQREKIQSLQLSLENLAQDPIFQEFLKNKEKFNLYLPREAKIENIIFDLFNHYQTLNLATFPGFSYRIKEADLDLRVDLPTEIKAVEFSFKDQMNYPALVSLIKLLEANIRLFSLKTLKVNKNERRQTLDVDFTWETFYLEK